MMTQRKNSISLCFIAFLNSLLQEEYITEKRKRHALKEVFIHHKVWNFSYFLHVLIYYKSVLVLQNFEMLQLLILPTKNETAG